MEVVIDDKFTQTTEEVSQILRLAAIKESDLNDVTQRLYRLSKEDANENVKLLVVDDHLLDILMKSESLSFRGKEDDTAVLCTKNQTYQIQQGETSNSLLSIRKLKLADDLKCKQASNRTVESVNVQGIHHTYYEVCEGRPRLEKLLDILEASAYKGIEYESIINPETLYTLDKLQKEIQCSDNELIEGLKTYTVVNINGYMRLISFEAEAQCLSHMLNVFDENSWEVDEVQKEVTYECLKELSLAPVLDCLFDKYTDFSEKSTNVTSLYRYNEEKVCKTVAKVLLSTSPLVEYNIFMESWHAATPEKIFPKEEYLIGTALIKWNNVTKTKDVLYFPEAKLSKNIMNRFHELFATKEKWTMEEIAPYISSLTTNKMNTNALLIKFTRCSTANGVKYYSSKHGK